MTETAIKQRGGKREGSGAKPKPPTTAIRIDNRLIDLVSVIKTNYTSGIITDNDIASFTDSGLKYVQNSTTELKIPNRQLHQHQDNLMHALELQYGTREKVKERLIAWNGSAPNTRDLQLLDIVAIYEAFNSELKYVQSSN